MGRDWPRSEDGEDEARGEIARREAAVAEPAAVRTRTPEAFARQGVGV